MSTPATADQVRTYLEKQGHTVQIDEDGAVQIKDRGAGDWIELPPVSERIVTSSGEVIVVVS